MLEGGRKEWRRNGPSNPERVEQERRGGYTPKKGVDSGGTWAYYSQKVGEANFLMDKC